MQVLLMILPILFSGLTFIIILRNNWISWANVPLDTGFLVSGKRLFGEHKTWRGFIIMPMFTLFWGVLLTVIFQKQLSLQVEVVYLLAGFAYSLFELPNSFIKRQLEIPPGDMSKTQFIKNIFIVIDQIDSLVGVAMIYLCFNFGTREEVLISVAIGIILHLLTDLLMKRAHLKK